MGRPIHPAAEIFHLMPEADLKALAADIKAHGLLEPITLDASGAVLDGRNRLIACELAGVDPSFTTWEGSNGHAVDFVLSRNLHRRHLDASQRGLVAGRVANLKHGGDRSKSSIDDLNPITQAEAAELLHVGKSTVERARQVLDDGVPELVAAVENGDLAVSVAAELAQGGAEVQREILATKGGRQLAKAARAVGRQARAAKPKPVRKPMTPPAEELELTAPPVRFPMLNGQVPAADFVRLDDWENLPAGERSALLQFHDEGRQLNEQSNASIEWARWSWNPVTGCRHDCPYCYARDIANSKYPGALGFEPALRPGRFGMPQATKIPAEAADDISYRNVFTCSMADLFGRWVPAEWIEAVLSVVRANPQWNFLFLTKFPKRCCEFEYPPNAWLGTTVDCQARVKNAEDAFERLTCGTKWLSIEPLLEPLKFTRLDLFDWVVIGGASVSSQTPAWVPPVDWIFDLHSQARAAGCRIYYKDNCGMLDSLRIREFPWVDPPKKELPAAFCYLPSLAEASP